MAGQECESEREYLLKLVKKIDDVLAETARINRRLRNARNAVHAIEDDLTELCQEATARLGALGDGSEA